MGHIFQVEWWEKHPSGFHFGLLWLMNLEKEMGKDLERNEAFVDILFMKIMEIR